MSLYAFIPLLTGQLSQNKPNLDLLAAQPLGISRDINSFPSLNGLAGRPGGDGAFSGIDALLALVGKGEEPGAKPGKLIPREIEGGKVFVLDDFENPDLSNNWTLTGDSFRSGRSFDGATYNQRTQDPSAQIKGFEGKQFAFSFEGRNSNTGKAVSKEFTIAWDQISFDIMGGTSNSTRIDLVVVNDSGTEQAVRTANGDGTLNFTRKNWNVKSYKGKTAKLVITDDSAAASYGFIGVDNIRGEGEVSFASINRPVIDPNKFTYQSTVLSMANRWREQFNLPGVWCAVIKDGQVVACVATGYSDINNNREAKLDQHLNVGSVSKVVTNTLIAHYVSSGMIRYQSTIGDIFPEMRLKNDEHPLLKATLAQLITHTAGLPKNVVEDYNMTGPAYRLDMLNKALASQCTTPGTAEVYSNIGPVLAVAMVERATGTSYESWLYGQLGQQIGFASPHQVNTDPDEVIPSYIDSTGTLVTGKLGDGRKRAFAPQGALSATLPDLCRFALYMLNLSDNFSTDSVASLISAYPGSRRSLAGWSVGSQYLFHNGDTGRGEYCEFTISPKTGNAVIFYTNTNTKVGGRYFMDSIGKDLDSLRYLR